MDLFDIVRAAPPPKAVRLETTASATRKRSSVSPVPISSAYNDDDSDTEIPVCSELPIGKLGDNTNLLSLDDSVEKPIKRETNESDNDHPLSSPPKTKAEQKMFTELPKPPSKRKLSDDYKIKPCRVCIKRLKLLNDQPIIAQTTGKRGRPRKKRMPDNEPESEAHKEKSSSPMNTFKITKCRVNIKQTSLQNGAKQRSVKLAARAPTPPVKTTPIKHFLPANNKTDLVKRFGSRFFNCVVKLKRLKNQPGHTPKKLNRKSKSKLSVSFSEAVEILGSKPRKSSSIASSSKTKSKLFESVPTRLQRVDATGNVLEDIDLSSNLVLETSETSRPTTSKRGQRAACNGGRRGKVKRPSLAMPVPELASLRLDDDHQNDPSNEDEEYIVPNEMPSQQISHVGCIVSPNPGKKLTVTTTVSDEEDTEVVEKENTALADNGTTDTLESLAQQEDIVENVQADTEAPETESNHQETEPNHQEPESQYEETVSEYQVTVGEYLETEPEYQETELDHKETELDQQKTEPDQQEAELDRHETDLDHHEIKSGHQETEPDINEAVLVYENTEQTEEDQTDSNLNDALEQMQVDSDSESLITEPSDHLEIDQGHSEPLLAPSDKNTSLSLTVTDDIVTTDDILDVHADLNVLGSGHDMSEKHNRRAIRSARFTSLESENSFKSANDLVTDVPITDLLIPTDAPNTFNGNEPPSGTSSVPQPHFSPIADIPSLDDDELGELVDRDFQLSTSRHTLSRGALDDIMTVLES